MNLVCQINWRFPKRMLLVVGLCFACFTGAIAQDCISKDDSEIIALAVNCRRRKQSDSGYFVIYGSYLAADSLEVKPENLLRRIALSDESTEPDSFKASYPLRGECYDKVMRAINRHCIYGIDTTEVNARLNRVYQTRNIIKEYYRLLPYFEGLINFSTVLYSADRQRAAIYFELFLLNGGEGVIYYFTKKDSKWTLVSRKGLWVAG